MGCALCRGHQQTTTNHRNGASFDDYRRASSDLRQSCENGTTTIELPQINLISRPQSCAMFLRRAKVEQDQASESESKSSKHPNGAGLTLTHQINGSQIEESSYQGKMNEDSTGSSPLEAKNKRRKFGKFSSEIVKILDNHDDDSMVSSLTASSVNQPIRGEQSVGKTKGETIQFASTEELCGKVIRGLLARSSAGNELLTGSRQSKAICVFLFGCQGSAKGELAIELVDHSKASSMNCLSQPCPIYNMIDVASLIAANIDLRIRQYHQLVADAARTKQRQRLLARELANGGTICSQEAADSQSSIGTNEDDERWSGPSDTSSSDGQSDSSTSGQPLSEDLSGTRSPTLTTLNTKQRSVLQLKLMRYFNSVTSKWVFGLLQREIERLESKLTEQCDKPTRDRVYLVNLIPSQLSLFKSCLYLSQNLNQMAKELRYPQQAIKFERRANMRLLSKDRRQSNLPPASNKQQGAHMMPAIRLASLKFLRLARGSSVQSHADRKSQRRGSNGTDGSPIQLPDLNEKLGPKFNESFAQQFEAQGKLLRVRYNPLRDQNYAHADDLETSHPSTAGQSMEGNKLDVKQSFRWAVELELIGDSRDLSGQRAIRWRAACDQLQSIGQLPLARFEEPSSAGHSSVVDGRRRQAGYLMTVVRVLGDTIDCSQQLKVKRIHGQLVRLKSRSRFKQLVKLIDEGKRLLEEDRRRWLLDQLTGSPLLKANDQLREQSSLIRQLTGNFRRERLSDAALWPPTGQPASAKSVLVVYSICVCSSSLSGIISEADKPEVTGRPPLVPMLMLNDGQVEEQPSDRQQVSSAHRPTSSRSASCLMDSANGPLRPKRHVQFKLGQDPRATPTCQGQPTSGSRSQRQAERRLWLSDDLLVSSSDELGAKLIRPFAELLRGYLSS